MRDNPADEAKRGSQPFTLADCSHEKDRYRPIMNSPNSLIPPEESFCCDDGRHRTTKSLCPAFLFGVDKVLCPPFSPGRPAGGGNHSPLNKAVLTRE